MNLDRREFLTTAAAVPLAAQTAKRPNVLLVMTDQHRADALGCYGNPVIRTPAFDALARGGARFTNCWTQHPVCMPSRASIFTGRYPGVHGVRSNGVPLARHETTLAHALSRLGYRTFGAGKFHFIPHFKGQLPTMETHPDPYYGFQEFHLGEDQRRGEQALWIERNHPRYAGKPDHEIPVELHNSYWVASHTIDFLRRRARDSEPFFAFASFVDPHNGYNPPEPYRSMYKPADMPGPVRQPRELEGKPPHMARISQGQKQLLDNIPYNRAQYYGEVTFIDDSLSRILKALDQYQLRENTLVVFLSDHSDLLGDHHLFFKGPYHYRHCASVPLIVNWPGRVQAGTVIDGIVQEIDVMPTILDLIGVPAVEGVQGRSQKSVLTGSNKDTGYESALIEHAISGVTRDLGDGQQSDASFDLYTLRTSEWRISYYRGKGYGELYDLSADPNEFVNRWADAKFEEIRRKLKDHLLDRVLSTRDPLPAREQRY